MNPTFDKETVEPIMVRIKPPRSNVIDAAYIARQAQWSEKTFGPGMRTHGVTSHIRKELDEILNDPFDLSEWADIIILALDGAWRSGHEPQEIIDAVVAKQEKNEQRKWPDWRKFGDEPIEHVKEPLEGP